ncbi:MAG: acetyl-CoA carboxylase carboxyltransferase subunit beta [Epsilonproteobacteria bacterium]|nr:acetyl-CoA carboxylase carboxyltransferase subunit beta [Campylobacterota bacterium]
MLLKKKKIDKSYWNKCKRCGELIYNDDLIENLSICTSCGAYFRMGAKERIDMLCDSNSFKEINRSVKSSDPLDFTDLVPYRERLAKSRQKCGMEESVITGIASIDDMAVAIGAMDFGFMGGSMGYATGEKLVRLIEYAIKKKRALVIVSASGGARMQEGALSLIQMARTAAALSRLAEHQIPYISIMTDPTTGGVAASFAMLGDINIAEPAALIGFAGPRVIEDTIGHKLPKEFQRSEFLLEHGFLDAIVGRRELKSRVASILKILLHKK